MTKSGINIQDQFLNQLRKEKTPLIMQLLDDEEMIGTIRSFDNFCIIFDSDKTYLIYKHAIATIAARDE